MSKRINTSFIKSGVILIVLMLVINVFALDTYAAGGSKPAKVKKVTLTSATVDTLSIKWSKAKRAKQYQIAFKETGTKKYSYVKTKKLSYDLANLKAGTRYTIKVRGLRGKKKGKWSKVKKWTTQQAQAAKDTSRDSTADVDYEKAANEAQMKVSVTDSEVQVSITGLGIDGTAAVYAVPANYYLGGDNITGLGTSTTSATAIGAVSLSTGGTVSADRYGNDGSDRLYDKYYIVKDGIIVKGPIYATEIAAKRGKVEKDVPSKKGLVDELDEESFIASKDLGSNWTALNIDFTSLVLANEDAKGNPIDNSRKNTDTVEVNGKTIYINKQYVSELDARLSRYEKMGINVVGICVSFVSTENTSNYPRALKYIDDARWTNGFNTSNDLGRDYFIAGMEYLANRYSKGGKGLICDYVIGNEIDYTYDWYEIIPNESTTGQPLPKRGSNMNLRTGEVEARAPFDTFMEEYSRTLRLANLAVKKYSNDIRVGISLSKEWAISRAERDNCDRTLNKRYDSYSPKEILDWLNYFSKKNGDYNWTLTPHNYPMANGNAAAYETGLTSGQAIITGDPDTTLMITLNNLEVLQLYLDRENNKFNGNPREVFFTENGSSSGSEVGTPDPKVAKEQAAEIAQYYYRAASLPSVKALIYYKVEDRDQEGATSFKLGLFDTTGAKKPSYDVWKYIDTNRSFEVSKKYLKSLSFMKNGVEYSYDKNNIKSYRDLMEIVESNFDWDKYWNEEALTPVKVETIDDERSLETDKTEYGADDPILVTASGSSSDTVGIYKKGQTAEDEPIYSYEIGSDTKSGVQYDIRAYGKLNTAYLKNNNPIEWDEAAYLPAGEYSIILSSLGEEQLRKEITITGTSIFDSDRIVTTNKKTYALGEDILVSANGSGKDWVGIYRKGEVPSSTVNSFYWYYVEDGTHVSGKPVIIQRCETNNRAGVLPAGEYELILLENDGYTVLKHSEPIVIEDGGAAGSDLTLESINYELENGTDGFANGTVTITKKDGSAANLCLMYWADENGVPLEGYTSLAKFKLNDKVTKREMQANTIIPPGAKTLVAYGVNGSTKSDESVMTILPEGCNYKLEDDYDVCFPVISDLHVVEDGSGNDYGQNTNYHTTMALQDIVKNMPDSIGVFTNGDMADHGKASEFMVLYNLFRNVKGAPAMHLAVGNHDWRTGNPDGQLQKYANLFNPEVEPENLYYDEWVAGYHFIYMAAEGEGTVAYISNDQLDWLENLLDEDTKADPTRPVFVLLHEGLADSMAGNYPGQWGYTNGVYQDSEVKEIVSKYGQVVMFGGHTHYDLNTENTVTVGSEDLPISVNTSAVGYLWDAINTPAGEYLYGAQGQYLKVFEDKIYIFGRDFITGEYVPSAMYVIEPAKLDVSKSKINMSVGDKIVNIGAETEEGFDLTYSSSNNKIARVDGNGNVSAVGPGTAKIYISTESSNTKAINRKIVYVTVTDPANATAGN